MPNKKANLTQSITKKKKRPNNIAVIKWWCSPTERPIFILIVIALIGGGLIIVSQLTKQSSFVRTYNYNSGSAGFSFQYPADFTNTTKPTVLGGYNSGYVAQQAKKDPDGAIIGFVRATFSPSTSDNLNLDESLRQALHGSQSDIQAFSKELGASTYGDCSKSSTIIAASFNLKLVKCPLSGALGTEYKGDILMGASNTGIYEFDYWIKASYWDSHAGAWNNMYKNISYK